MKVDEVFLSDRRLSQIDLYQLFNKNLNIMNHFTANETESLIEEHC